ncbi:hypothetical protein CBL_06152 [Carabus blaptoides fortunei]
MAGQQFHYCWDNVPGQHCIARIVHLICAQQLVPMRKDMNNKAKQMLSRSSILALGTFKARRDLRLSITGRYPAVCRHWSYALHTWVRWALTSNHRWCRGNATLVLIYPTALHPCLHTALYRETSLNCCKPMYDIVHLIPFTTIHDVCSHGLSIFS